jgi:hypothetical protein
MALLPRRVESLLGINTVTAGVAAFGKHPVYADHLPLDLGDQTALSARLRETFYNRGVISRVGDWELLQKKGQAIPYGHFVLYREPDGAALMRIWPSRDAVKRSDIPMILAALTSGVGIDWLLANGSAALIAAETRCKAAATLEDLSAAVHSAGQDMRARASHADKKHTDPLPGFLAEASFQTQLPALVAALRSLWEFLPLDGDTRAALPDRAATTRSAAWASPPLEGLGKWSALLDAALAGRKSRYFLIAPDSEPWIDILIGEPNHRQFTCLRANGDAVVPAAPKPDELTDEFGAKAVAWLGRLAQSTRKT